MIKPPLHIELILGSAEIGGTERQVVRLARELTSRGISVSVVVLQGGGPLLQQFADLGLPLSVVGYGGFSPSRVPGLPTRNSLVGLWRLVRHARPAGRPDVSHAFLDGAVAVAPLVGILGLPWGHSGCRAFRPKRLIAGVRGNRDVNPRTARRFVRTLRRADAVVCNADHLAAEMVALGANLKDVRVIANGVDRSCESSGAPSGAPPTAVVVANLIAYKGHGDLLGALGMLPDGVGLHVRLCGVGPERDSILRRVAELGFDRTDSRVRVSLVDPPADVGAELAGAQFAIHPSHTEGLSNAILEELASGLPVIACSVGGNAQLIDHGVNGMLVPPGDPESLAGAIAEMVLDEDMRSRLAGSARSSVERFSWAACTQAHIDLYQEVHGRAHS